MKFEGLGFSAEIDDKDYHALDKVANSDLVGLIGGDWLKYWRWNNLVNIASKFRKKCEENNFNPKEVAPKFLSHFFESASQEDDESIQNIWANLLYSESKENGSVSLKTIQVLKFMTREDAKILNNLFQFIIKQSLDSGIIYRDNEYMSQFDIRYIDLLRMEDLGLISLDPFLTVTKKVTNEKVTNEKVAFWTDDYIIHLTNNNSSEELSIDIPIYLLTKSGFDIYKQENHPGNLDSLQYVVNQLKTMNMDINISLHELMELNHDGSYRYKQEDLSDGFDEVDT